MKTNYGVRVKATKATGVYVVTRRGTLTRADARAAAAAAAARHAALCGGCCVRESAIQFRVECPTLRVEVRAKRVA